MQDTTQTPHLGHWFEIYVQDMQRAKEFYEAVLGIKMEKLDTSFSTTPIEMWGFPSAPKDKPAYGVPGALVKVENPSEERGSNGTLIYFSCQDCAIEAKRIENAGGTLKREKMGIGPYGFIALGVDTEGNMFGLHSWE